MKKLLKKFRRKSKDTKKEAIPSSNMPKITNQTVEQHREEVLSSARKFIYPLQHSKHKIVLVTTTIILASTALFLTYTVISLYRFQSTSAFMYRVAQVIPFPVARQGSTFIAYENYLFELRRYKHFYERQQKLDFNSESGQEQLAEQKKRSLEKVINDAYIKKMAKERNIEVSDREVDDEITLLRSQNRLGSSDDVLEDVLKEFYGWSRNDLKRTIKQQILQRKLLESLDNKTLDRAKHALEELNKGAKFEDVAKKYSDDPSSENGGDYGFSIDKSNSDLPTQVTAALFSLDKGQISEIVNTGYSLEIVTVTGKKDGRVNGAHIVFNFRPISEHLNDAKDKQPTRVYINLK